MKYVIGIIACSFFLGVGFIIGGQNSSSIEKEEKLVQAEEPQVDQESEFLVGEEFLEETPSKKKPSKLGRKEKKERVKSHLKYLIKKAPFSLVKKMFREREKAIDKAAFGNYEKVDYKNEEKSKDFEKETFNSIVPAIKRSFQYHAEGSFEFKGHTIPYKLSISLSNPWPGSKKKKSIPTKPRDFSFMLFVRFDTSGVGFGDDKFVAGSGSGLFDTVREGSRVFFKESIFYRESDTLFNDILYILAESPGADGEFGALRIFDSSNSKWTEVTDSIIWKPISEEAFKETRKTMWK